MNDDKVNHVISLFQEGENYAVISACVGISHRAIKEIISQHHLKRVMKPLQRFQVKKSRPKSDKPSDKHARKEKVYHLFDDLQQPVDGFAYWVRERKMPLTVQCRGILTDVKTGMDFWCQNTIEYPHHYCASCYARIYVKAPALFVRKDII